MKHYRKKNPYLEELTMDLREKRTDKKDLYELQALFTAWGLDKNLMHSSNSHAQTVKLFEEGGEVARGVLKNDSKLYKDGIGDVIVVLTILCGQLGTTLEECANIAWDEIKYRNGVTRNGTFIKAS